MQRNQKATKAFKQQTIAKATNASKQEPNQPMPSYNNPGKGREQNQTNFSRETSTTIRRQSEGNQKASRKQPQQLNVNQRDQKAIKSCI